MNAKEGDIPVRERRRTEWTKLRIGTRELVGFDMPFSVKVLGRTRLSM